MRASSTCRRSRGRIGCGSSTRSRWQLLFFLGFAFGRGWLVPPGYDRRLMLAALGVVAAALPFSCQYGWSCFAAWGAVPWLGEVHQALGAVIDKTHLAPLRIVHFLAIAYLAYTLAGEGGRRLQGSLTPAVQLVGRQTLAVFLAGLILAQALGVVLDLVGRTSRAPRSPTSEAASCCLASRRFANGSSPRPGCTPGLSGRRRAQPGRGERPAAAPMKLRSGPRALGVALACVLALAASAALAGEVHFGLRRAEPGARPRGPLRVVPTRRRLRQCGGRWPVLYLFHGLGDDERAWATLGRAAETLDRLIAAGKLKPLLVVMPMARDSWYVDNPDPGGRGLVAQALSRDLVDHVDRSYPTAACRAGRALGGLSMGGYGALLYAMDNPRRYAAAFSFSGSLFRPMPDDEAAGGTPTDAHVPRRLRRALRSAALQPLEPVLAPAGLYRRPGAHGVLSHRRQTTTSRASRTATSPSIARLPMPASRRRFGSSRAGISGRCGRRELGPALEWLDRRLSAVCP